MMKAKTKTIAIAASMAFLIAAQTAMALSSYVSRIPNGSAQSCANCHVGGVPPDLNPFGNAFSATHAWSASLAKADSDGDGFSNGQELGDPAGVWTVGAALPIPGAQVTLPGDPTSVPTLTPPPITLSSPAGGTTAPAPYTGPLVATSTDAAAAIAKIEFFNGTTSLGAVTAAPYSLPVNLGAGTYNITAKITDYLGAVNTSAAAQITVTAAATAPTITTQPANQTVTAGANVSFSVVAAGTAPLAYQWKKNGSNISGATSATLALSNVSATDAASYTVTVSNAAGSITSAAATLTVNAAAVAPTITTQPANQTVTAGANVSFSVVAAGTAPLAYQWKKNGSNISSATSATLALSNVSATDAASYTVTVSNAAGSITSAAATLIVNAAAVAPTITTQPANQTVTAGANVSFSVVAAGTAPLAYQWKKNGVNISSATSATLALSNVSATDAASYTVTVSNAAGSITSAAATLTVNAAAVAPTITTQPANQTVTAGANVSFSVVAAGTAPLAYQWKKNGVNISSATSATLALSNVSATDAASYTVTVSNAAGSITSAAATLTVNAAAVAPTITTQPASQTVTAGANVSFSVVAAGTAPLAYQWKKNGSNISGATSATLALSNVSATDAASYTVTVSNAAGSITSAAATLTVNAAAVAPTITTQPANQTVTAGANVSFSVVAAGTAPLAYQWKKNGSNISGATSATLALSNVSATDAASYTVTVTNVAGSITSAAATLTVNAATVAPTITTQPMSQSVAPGATVTFSVVASGTAPLKYQWKKSGANITGATNAMLTLTSVTTNSAGIYTVEVSNSAGSVASTAATLTVTTPTVLSITLTSPTNGAVIETNAEVELTAEVTPDANVSEVVFMDGTNVVGSVTNSPYSLVVSNLAAGEHVLTAKVITTDGKEATSDPVTIAVMGATNEAPTVSMVLPHDGSRFNTAQQIVLAASASAPAGTTITNVEFFAGTVRIGAGMPFKRGDSENEDGRRASSSGPVSYVLLWSQVPVGQYAITAVATDSQGAHGTSAPVHVSVVQPPRRTHQND